MTSKFGEQGAPPDAGTGSSATVGRPNNRRALLRLVAGGAPLLTANPVGASLAASSAMRAVRHDATLNPPMVTSEPDGWIRAQIEIVEVRLATPGSKPTPGPSNTSGSTGSVAGTATGGASTVGTVAKPVEPGIQAYKLAGNHGPRYYQVNGMLPINSLFVEEVGKVGTVHSLVLFDGSGGIHGVDPGRSIGGNGLQGLHCSSWRSIAPQSGTFPGCGV